MNNQEEYLRLATVSRGRLIVSESALDKLSEYDFIYIISYLGNLPQHRMISSETGLEVQNEEAIWMSKYPQYSPRLKRYIISLSTNLSTKGSPLKIKESYQLHLLLPLLSQI